MREHALAFGRALAYSTRSELIVIDESRSEVLQTRASMTYPIDLREPGFLQSAVIDAVVV